MEIRDAVKLLRLHNRWRRGDEIDMASPREIGIAIDTVCDYVERGEDDGK